jgi:hypothetical protein
MLSILVGLGINRSSFLDFVGSMFYITQHLEIIQCLLKIPNSPKVCFFVQDHISSCYQKILHLTSTWQIYYVTYLFSHAESSYTQHIKFSKEHKHMEWTSLDMNEKLQAFNVASLTFIISFSFSVSHVNLYPNNNIYIYLCKEIITKNRWA